MAINLSKLVRVFAVWMLLGGIFIGLVGPVMAKGDPERIDGNTFNGLDYGWSLTWDDEVWTDPYEEHVDGTEYVSLETVDEPTASSRIVATDMFGGDVDDCVTGWEEVLRNSGSLRHVEAADLKPALDLADGAAEGGYTYNVRVDGELVDFVEYVQCQPFGADANLVLTLASVSDDYEDAIPLFVDLVDGLSLDASDKASDDSGMHDRPEADDDSADDTGAASVPGGSGIDGNSFTSVNFDWSVTWDDRFWEPITESENNSDGNDFFQIQSTRQDAAPVMGIEFETTVRLDGNVDACADDELIWMKQDPGMSDITEADVELPEVDRDSAVFAYAYAYSPTGGKPIDFIELGECLPLDNDGAILQIRLVTPAMNYDDALPYFIDVTGAIAIDPS